MAGYAEILDDELPDTTHTTVRYSLGRIRAGVDRMRRLIDDLLAYATARDAELQLQPVDLQEIVADVIAERTVHLRHTFTKDQPGLFPDIYTGALPIVHADRAMVRQLLDNLVGNALKYATPGQPARIDISAHQRPGDTHARVEIADRGIGVSDNPGGGTRLHLTLPTSPAPVSLPAYSTTARAAAGTGNAETDPRHR